MTDHIDQQLPVDAHAPARAREALDRARSHLPPHLLDDLRLLISELVTNAVGRTGAESLRLRLHDCRDGVHVEVADQGRGYFAPPPRGGAVATGWELFLVERLAERWGVERDGGMTRVWFELRA